MIFLNHGSYGACPKKVLAAQGRWRDQLEAQPCQFINTVAPGVIRRAAGNVASFIGARSEDVALVENTTCGINAVLKSLQFSPGDRVLAVDHIYNAIRNTLNFVLEPVDAKLDLVPLGLPVASADAVVDAIDQALTSNTKLLVVDHVASVSAVRFPLERIAELAQRRGISVLVDAAHAPGMLDLDVPALGVDWYVGNCHKWLCAPKGAAFLWAREDRQDGLHPTVISHDLGKGFTAEFDKIGTRDGSSWFSIPDAIAFHEELGGAALRQRNHEVAIEGATRLAEHWDTDLGAPDAMFGSMATIRLPGDRPATRAEADRIKSAMWQRHRIEAHVMPFAEALWLRISVQAYNELDEVLALAERVPELFSA